jgi:phosphoribosyl-ATP pyrophosphohydrolase
VGHFLITFVEREGRMGGIDLERAKRIVDAAHPARVTIAGGITTADEVAALDRMGADAQIGMALYTGKLELATALAAPLHSDRPDGLWPTVVTDEQGVALGLAYSDSESLQQAVNQRRGIYRSRSRGLWVKGKSSGNTQELLRVELDCDRDTLRFTVRQRGSGFCHLDTRTCWGPDRGLSALARLLAQRRIEAPPGSYTKRLFEDPALLRAKLLEEARELADTLQPDTRDPDTDETDNESRDTLNKSAVVHEAADLLYFTLVSLAANDISLSQVDDELDRRALRLGRRPGDAKDSNP